MNIRATILIVSALTLALVAAPSIGSVFTISNAKKDSGSSTSTGSSSSGGGGGGASSSSSSSSATSPTLTSKEMKQLTSCLNTQNKAGVLNHNAVTTCLDQAKGIAPLTTSGAGAAASSASGSAAGAGGGAGGGGAAAGGTA
jgi:hypothetical protein